MHVGKKGDYLSLCQQGIEAVSREVLLRGQELIQLSFEAVDFFLARGGNIFEFTHFSGKNVVELWPLAEETGVASFSDPVSNRRGSALGKNSNLPARVVLYCETRIYHQANDDLVYVNREVKIRRLT